MESQRARNEDMSSWVLHVARTRDGVDTASSADASRLHRQRQRVLKHNKHSSNGSSNGNSDNDSRRIPVLTEEEKLHLDELERQQREHESRKSRKEQKKRLKHSRSVYENPGIQPETVHGMIIDAGSTGSRMHVYEFNPRVLDSAMDVTLAVSGRKLSFPGTDTRWTDRLRPGLNEFASIYYNDQELLQAVGDYLRPLIEFAKDILHSKSDRFHRYPIFLKATAGMRELPYRDRQRVISAVRTLLANETFNPFAFEEERARVISGEEEAIYGFAGVNFVLGTLLEDSEGSGTVIEPRLTYGALDLGGGSAQISFFQPEQDIMANLFKLQIGQGKHWNVYAHSFLYFGIDEAYNRMGARLSFPMGSNGKTVTQPLAVVHNPCLPGGGVVRFSSKIHILPTEGIETWQLVPPPSSSSGSESNTNTNNSVNHINTDNMMNYTTVLRNDDKQGNYDQCASLTRALLRKENNSWCNFAHRGDCSFAGVYQPQLPKQSKNFGEFLAFSNFYHVWDFLGLDMRSSIRQLQEQTRYVCDMTLEELKIYNSKSDAKDVDEYDLPNMCFRAVYVNELLHEGYGFSLDDYVTATKVIDGQKVGWALGSMLYEINTMPWQYVESRGKLSGDGLNSGIWNAEFMGVTLGSIILIFTCFMARRMGTESSRRRYRQSQKVVVERLNSMSHDGRHHDDNTESSDNGQRGYGSVNQEERQSLVMDKKGEQQQEQASKQ